MTDGASESATRVTPADPGAPVAPGRLLELTVTDLALIDRLRLTLEAGLNVITGETGAGKSLLIDALGWAQDRVRDRCPLVRIEREVANAFRIARGDEPLDPAARWECAA